MKKFEISWRDEVFRSVEIEADTREEAFKVWSSGNWDIKKSMETDCETISDKDEIINDMVEVENEF